VDGNTVRLEARYFFARFVPCVWGQERKTKMQNFEKYLEDRFWKEVGCLDDDFPDCFDKFIEEMDPTDMIAHADNWGKSIIRECHDKFLKAAIKGVDDVIKNVRKP
jgi:hypothetical protein